MATGLIVAATGALIGGVGGAITAQRDANKNLERAKRDSKLAIRDATSTYDIGKEKISIRREALGTAREDAGFRLDQAEDSYERATDMLSGERSRADESFANSLRGLQTSRVRAHEDTYRQETGAMSAAAAVGVRGGSGIATVRDDAATGRSDIEFETQQERERIDLQMEGMQAQFDNMDAEIRQRIAAERQGYDSTLATLNQQSRTLDLDYEALKEGKDLAIEDINNQVGDAKDATKNAWGRGALSGALSGMGLGMDIYRFGKGEGWKIFNR